MESNHTGSVELSLRRPDIREFLAMAGIFGPLLLLAAEIMVFPTVPHYSPIRDSISSLGWAALGWVENGSLSITGLLVEIFGAVLFLGIRGGNIFRIGIICLVCSGFGLILAGAFRTDLPDLPATLDGTIHGIGANVAFTLLPLAGLLIAPSLRKDPYWRPLFPFTIITAAFALVWIAIYRIWLPEQLGWFGLYERILAGVEIVWVEVMAFWLLRQFLKSVKPDTYQTEVGRAGDSAPSGRIPEPSRKAAADN
jgi:hypothetical membrane protein